MFRGRTRTAKHLMGVTRDAAPFRMLGVMRRRSHRVLVALLLAIGTLLTPITIVILFGHTQITDTSRYVQNVAPLSSDPAIQAYVADDVTNRLMSQVDVAAYVRDVLPPRADGLAGPIANALEGFVRETTLRVLQTDQFQKLWTEANRISHAQLVKVLTGNGRGVVNQSNNGEVTIDLSAVVADVQERLQASGLDVFSKLPIARIGGQIPVFESKDLYTARKAVGALDKLAFVLPFIVLAAFAGAIFLSRDRRRGFLAAALCFALGALLLGIALTVARSQYLDAIAPTMPHDAAAAVFDTLIRFLRTSVRAALTLSLIVVVAVFFSGPSRAANGFRRGVRTGANWLGARSDAAGWGRLGASAFVVRHKTALRVIVAAIAFALLLIWDHPTPAVIFWVGVATIAVLGVVEFFGREPVAPDLELPDQERTQVRPVHDLPIG